MIVVTSVLGLEMAGRSALYVASWRESIADLDNEVMAGLAERCLRVARRLEAIVTPHIDAAETTQVGPISEEIG